jgi:hypothetical protein
MIEPVLAFLAGWLLSWPSLFVLFGLGVLFEHADWRGTSLLLTLITAVSAFFFFDVTLIDLAFIAVGYLVIGVLWSFWRYRRYVRKEVELIKQGNHSPDVQGIKLSYLVPSNNTEIIVGWIMVWPFSAIGSIVGDLIDLVTELVTTTFRKIYASIYNAATKGLLDESKRLK